jgi:hypothetical protein
MPGTLNVMFWTKGKIISNVKLVKLKVRRRIMILSDVED